MDFSSQSPGQARFLPGRWIIAWELAIVLSAILAMLWNTWEFLAPVGPWKPFWQIGPGLLAGVVVVFSILRLRENRQSLGLAPDHLRQGWSPLIVYTLGSLIFLAIVGWRWGQPHFNGTWVFRYLGGMIFQQIALQCFLNNRIYYLAAGRSASARLWWSVIGSAVFFASLHAPNPGLVAGTLVAGAFWSWHFRRYQNLPALMLSHLILGAGAMILLGQGPLLRLRVGWPAWETLIGNRPL